MPKKENKIARFGMRVAPSTKEEWVKTAHSWGYNSVSEWLEAMANWAIAYETCGGDYNKYLESVKAGS